MLVKVSTLVKLAGSLRPVNLAKDREAHLINDRKQLKPITEKCLVYSK